MVSSNYYWYFSFITNWIFIVYRFLDLQAQATRCKLDGIKKLENEHKWHREAIKAVMNFRDERGEIFIQNWENSIEVVSESSRNNLHLLHCKFRFNVIGKLNSNFFFYRYKVVKIQLA